MAWEDTRFIMDATDKYCILQLKLYMSFLTLQGPPMPPTDATAHYTPEESLLLSWSAPFSAHSIPLTYEVEISAENGTIIATFPSNSTTLHLTSLPHCAPLQIVVYAINAAGRSNSSAPTNAFLFTCECAIVKANSLLNMHIPRLKYY